MCLARLLKTEEADVVGVSALDESEFDDTGDGVEDGFTQTDGDFRNLLQFRQIER